MMVLRATGVAYNTKRRTVIAMRRAVVVMAAAALSFTAVTTAWFSSARDRDREIESEIQSVSGVVEKPEAIEGCRKAEVTDASCLQAWLVRGVSRVGTRETLGAFN